MKNPTPRYVGLSLLGVCAGLLVMLAGFFSPPPADRFTVLVRLTDFARVYLPSRTRSAILRYRLSGGGSDPSPFALQGVEESIQCRGSQCGRPVESKVGRHDLIGCPRGPLLRVHLAVWGGRRRLDCGGLEGTIGVKSPHISGPSVSTARPRHRPGCSCSWACVRQSGLAACVRAEHRAGASGEPQCGRAGRGQIDETGQEAPRATF